MVKHREQILCAIKTKYKGIEFRSRLEARWAVYFDAEGIIWEYEKEGYKLPSGNYLPDFWLPQVKMWAEVKPDEFTEEEITKAKELSKITKYSVLMLIGIPDEISYFALPGLIDYVVSRYHNYHEEEGRFYSSTGCIEEETRRLSCEGMINKESINKAKNAKFERDD